MTTHHGAINLGSGIVRVIVSPLIQTDAKIKMSSECPCSPQVSDEFNAWLRQMFGETEPFYLMQGGKVLCGAKVARALREGDTVGRCPR